MKRHPLIAFLVLTAVFSWSLWIPIALAGHGVITVSPTLLTLFQIWGGLGPGLAALIITFASGGQEGTRRLLGRLSMWRAHYAWYLLALFLPAVIALFTTVLHTMFAGEAPDFAHLPIEDTALWSAGSPRLFWGLIASLVFQLGSEELGWRGFLLPRLQQRYDALVSSVVLAATWAVWYLPLLFADPGTAGWWVLFSLFLTAIPGAIIPTWIFNNTHGSLVLVVLHNAAVKLTGLVLAAPAASGWVTLTPYWVTAILIVAWAGAQRLSRNPLHEKCREQSEPLPAGAPVALA